MQTSDILTNETENKAEGKQTRKQYEKTDALLICPLQMKLGWTGDGTCPVSMRTDRDKRTERSCRLILFSISIRDVDKY